MKPITGIDEVKEASDVGRLPAGGYVCKYTNVKDEPDKNYLYMEFDIAEGDHAGHFADLADKFAFWGGKCYRSYTERALPMFKRMCSAVTKSNPGFVFDGNKYCDEKTLVGKYVGMVLGEEEYIGNDGSKKTRLYVARELSIEDVRSGNFKVPKLKELKEDNNAPVGTKPGDEFVNVPEGDKEEIPFE